MSETSWQLPGSRVIAAEFNEGFVVRIRDLSFGEYQNSDQNIQAQLQ